MNTEELDVMFVKNTTPTKQLGTAIIKKFEENTEAPIILRGIGAGSITQCVYGLTIAKNVLKKKGFNINIEFDYKDVINVSETRFKKPKITAIEFIFKKV